MSIVAAAQASGDVVAFRPKGRGNIGAHCGDVFCAFCGFPGVAVHGAKRTGVQMGAWEVVAGAHKL